MAKLSEVAVLAKLEISLFHVNRTDEQVTSEVAQQHQVARGSGRYVKKILETETLNKLRTLGQEIRKWHNEHTLRWDEGVGILPSQMFAEYTDWMRQKRAEWDGLVELFVQEYPEALQEAEKKLNGLFNPEDYPQGGEVANRFGIRTVFYPFPEANDFHRAKSFLVTQLRDVEDGLNQRLSETSKGMTVELLGRIISPLAKMASQLASDKSFNKRKVGGWPLFDNVLEMANLVAELNVENDLRVAAAVEEVRKVHTGWHPEKAKKSSAVRQSVQQEADELVRKLSAYMKQV